MEITGEKGLGKKLKVFLQICFYLGVIGLVLLPFVLHIFGFNIGASAFVIYPNGIVLLIIAWNFIKLFGSLEKNNPFCEENVKTMKKLVFVALVEACFWFIDLLYETILAKSDDIIFNATLIFLCVLFLGVAIALYILSELFKQATIYKKENELTI